MADVLEDASNAVGEFVAISGIFCGGLRTSEEAVQRWRAYPRRALGPMMQG